VGSVHQLQGSERPLVIFSTAVDSPPGSAFFDKAFNILNVARSRATDSFILVASPGMLSRRDGNPFGFFAADIRDNGRRLYPRPQEFAQPRPNETVARMSAGIG
jgi:superfamily I DNA and/or RNA helicase